MFKPGSVFKSLETDKEFVARLKQRFPWYSSYYSGQGIDDEAWACFQVQRKIIERAV